MDKETQEIKAVYEISQDLLCIPFLQSKQGMTWKIAEHLYKLGYRKLPKDKPPECEHNWVFRGTRHESRNYGSWDVDVFYCSKCLVPRDGGASNQVGW